MSASTCPPARPASHDEHPVGSSARNRRSGAGSPGQPGTRVTRLPARLPVLRTDPLRGRPDLPAPGLPVPACRIVVTLKARQSLDTSKRVRRKHLAMAQAGITVGGNRAFGWLADKETKDEPAAALLVAGADQILAGVGLHTICRQWNDLGIASAMGKKWQKPVLRNIYLSPRIVGYRVYGPTSVPLEKRYVVDADGQPVKGQQQPILDLDVWEAVVAKLRDPSRVSKHVHIGGRKYLLSGIICCGFRGRHLMGGYDRRWGKHHYACKAVTAGGCGKVGVTGRHVDDLVSELVLAYLAGRDVEAEVGRWPRAGELAKAEAKIAKLMGAYDRDELPGPYVFPRVREQEQSILHLRAEQAEWLRAHTGPKVTNLAEGWPSLELEQRWEIISTVIEAVVLKAADGPTNRFDPERVEVVWRP
ncbi:Recombinase [Frankia casuarinae]|uniref:Recombinase n=1 Tax=Frankia casuarinae (strain DSM 45818 / CECT 9043 / HFP020203 / CcI3) TaxID=106370 RepID=Q2J9V9_FRACC|nr:Recombinase [Frankia casuarinae]